MTIERSLTERASMHAALGEPARLAMVEALALGDASPHRLGEDLGLASNLLAHHVHVLSSAGLVGRHRSEADGRRAYLRLLPAAYPFVRPASYVVPRVVFICTHNSARSQLAAALLGARVAVAVTSAGTHPATRVHPRAVAVAHRHGFDLRGARTAHVGRIVRSDDLVISVCDRAYEETVLRSDLVNGLVGGNGLHWSVPDPVALDTAQAFTDSYDDLAGRVERLAESISAQEEQ